MHGFRVTIPEILMLMALFGVLAAFQQHVARQEFARETVQAIEVSPDDEYLIRGSDLGVAVFRLADGSLVGNGEGSPGCVAISADSQWFATGGIDGSVRLWSLAEGRLERQFGTHSDWVRAIAFSSDGQRVYSASRDGTVKVWDLNGETVGELPVGDSIESMAIAPDDARVAVGVTPQGAKGHEIQIWNAETFKLEQTLVGAEHAYVYQLAFHPELDELAVGLSVPNVAVWDLSQGKQRLALPQAAGGDLTRWSPTGRLIATGEYGGFQVRDSETGSTILDIKTREVLFARFSEDEDQLTTASGAGAVTVWDLAKGRYRSRRSGVTTRPSFIPWGLVVAYFVWLAAWVAVERWTIRRERQMDLARGPLGFRLVAVASMVHVGGGLLAALLLSPETVPSPGGALGALLLLALAPFVLFVGCGLLVAAKVTRQRIVHWGMSLGVLAFSVWTYGSLLIQALASV